MAYTGHGHHIPGTLKGQGVTTAPAPTHCGGVEECPRCKQDVEEYTSRVTTVEDYQNKAKQLVRNYIDGKRAGVGLEPLTYELYVPWFAKELQNWKATVATTMPDDEGWYFEVTHNGNRRESYIDFYRKFDNVVIPD
jgi:hypothetical protein